MPPLLGGTAAPSPWGISSQTPGGCLNRGEFQTLWICVFFLRVHPYGGLFIYKLGTVRDGQSLVIEQL